MAKKILIVEDDEAIAQNLKVALNGDYEIFIAQNGFGAISLAKELMPNLILLDYMLPDTNGLEIIRQLKEEEGLREIPVVVLTNRTDSNTVSGILESGGKEFWSKTDLSMGDIVKKVDKILK